MKKIILMPCLMFLAACATGPYPPIPASLYVPPLETNIVSKYQDSIAVGETKVTTERKADAELLQYFSDGLKQALQSGHLLASNNPKYLLNADVTKVYSDSSEETLTYHIIVAEVHYTLIDAKSGATVWEQTIKGSNGSGSISAQEVLGAAMRDNFTRLIYALK
jgi:hypothetical protein